MANRTLAEQASNKLNSQVINRKIGIFICQNELINPRNDAEFACTVFALACQRAVVAVF